MAQEDFEDLNVMNLTETKSQRAPTSESIPPLPSEPSAMKWLAPALVGILALIAVALICRLPSAISDAS